MDELDTSCTNTWMEQRFVWCTLTAAHPTNVCKKSQKCTLYIACTCLFSGFGQVGLWNDLMLLSTILFLIILDSKIHVHVYIQKKKCD